MTNTKIYIALSKLNTTDLNRFKKFVYSPYFNINETLQKLLSKSVALIKANKQDYSKEKTWQSLFPDESFDDKRFRKICSDLLKLFEKFLIQEAFEQNPLHQANYLIKAVSGKKQERLYNTTMNTARRLSARELNRSASYYYYQYQIEKNYYQLTDFDAKRGDRSNVEEITNNLDRFYLAEKLKYYCNLLSRQKIITHDYEFLFLDEIIEHIKKYDYTDIAPISIYYYIYLTLTNEDDPTIIEKLKALIDKHIDKFPPAEAIDIFFSAINYWIRKLNQGNQNALKQILILFKEGLHRNLLHVNGELDPFLFKNIVVVALRQDEFDWVESFIHQYGSTVYEEYRENATSYNLATLHFYKKDYRKVIQLLQTIEYDDVNYNLDAKSMLLATYYETDEFDALDSLFGSFRTYLTRNKKIPEARRKNYSNLIKFTKKLSRLNTNDKVALSKLKTEITETNGIVSKRWLLEKVGELE